MPSPELLAPTRGTSAVRGRVAVVAVLAAGALAASPVPGAVAQPAPAAGSVLPVLRDYGPPPSWSTSKAICSPVSLGAGRVRYGLPPSKYNTKMTSLRVVAKRRVPCSKARVLARRYFVKGVESGYDWLGTKAWGRDDGRGAAQYRGTRKGGLRVVFLAAN